jgi:hypothetical protein
MRRRSHAQEAYKDGRRCQPHLQAWWWGASALSGLSERKPFGLHQRTGHLAPPWQCMAHSMSTAHTMRLPSLVHHAFAVHTQMISCVPELQCSPSVHVNTCCHRQCAHNEQSRQAGRLFKLSRKDSVTSSPTVWSCQCGVALKCMKPGVQKGTPHVQGIMRSHAGRIPMYTL